ncbi:uncharacterized protein TNCV_2560301 [Trichonephila clavipes]|uniref:Uncharacterized protein n=1 Tax=Trichonephila clavipes TaxID=2585209 RepID=A0A8X6UWF9_TRICX|nr:uncharacterized protein TNCV_2560301 [Trichonephila clavipes]
MGFKTLLPRQHYLLAAMVEKNGNLYLRLVDVGALLGRSKVYEFVKRFDNLVIQGKEVLPAHKQYPIMTQKSKLVTTDVVFKILIAELSSLATSFAISLNAGSALVQNPNNLFVESYKISPVLHVQDSLLSISILMVYEACMTAKARPSVELAERLSLPERIPTSTAQRPAKPKRSADPERPAERPPLEMVDPSVSANTVEVTPLLITRCDKST